MEEMNSNFTDIKDYLMNSTQAVVHAQTTMNESHSDLSVNEKVDS